MSPFRSRRLRHAFLSTTLAAATVVSATAALGVTADAAHAGGRCPQDVPSVVAPPAPHIGWSPMIQAVNQVVLQRNGWIDIPLIVEPTTFADAYRKLTGAPAVANVIVTMRVQDDPAVPPGQMRVDLDTGPNVTWDKAIRPRNDCSRVRGLIYKTAAATGVASMTIENAGGDRYSGFDTLELHKPGFLGIWFEVAEIDRDQMWALGSGNRVTITWLAQ